MKVDLELPKLEIIMAEAEKRGFKVTLDPIRVTSYRAMVSCNGYEASAWVHEDCHGKVVLDTGGYWQRDAKSRVRISVHKKVAFMGNKLAWTLGGAAGEISKVDAESEEEKDVEYKELPTDSLLEEKI